MGKNRKKANKKTNVKSEISILKCLFDKKENIVSILGVIGVLYPIVNAMYNLRYQSECESFYRIPGKYFNSTINNRLLYLAYILMIVIICTIPVIIRNYNEKRQIQAKGLTVYTFFWVVGVGIEIGLLNVYNLSEIMKQTYKTYGCIRSINNFLNKNETITIIVVIVIGIIALCGITFRDMISMIKQKRIQKMINDIINFSIIISLLLMIYGTVFKFSISIEHKTKYELVTIDEEEYVVLAEYDDKMLVVLYDVKVNEQYIFDTDSYWFYEKYQGTHRYITLKHCPEINKAGGNVCE